MSLIIWQTLFNWQHFWWDDFPFACHFSAEQRKDLSRHSASCCLREFRLQWPSLTLTGEHAECTEKNQSNFISDESKFNLFGPDGEREEVSKFWRKKCHVWEMISSAEEMQWM